MPKILLINTVLFSINGMSTVIMDIYRKLKNEYDIDIVCQGYLDDSYKEEIEGHYFLLPSRTKTPFKYRKELKKIIKNNHYDIIHVHGNSATMFLETSLINRKKTKVIVHGHNVTSHHKNFHKILYPIFKYTYDLAIVPSKEAGRYLCHKRNYLIVNNSIDVDKFIFNKDLRTKLKEEYNLVNKKVLMHVGLFNRQKNHRFIVELIKEMENKEDIKVVFVGDGYRFEEIKKLVKDNNLDKYFLFLGKKSNACDYYNMADLFILPSLYESFGIVILEALVNGLKVISSTNVPREINFNNNVTFLDLDPKLWIDKINEINYYERLSYDELAKEKGYDSKTNINRYQIIYDNILKKI